MPRTTTSSVFQSLNSDAPDISRSRTVQAIDALKGNADVKQAWLSAVARLVSEARPDLFKHLSHVLTAIPAEQHVLRGLTIGELGVVYEALLAEHDRSSRKESGQFFTPDDVAEFMAKHLNDFGTKSKWLDPCCGVGNLSWHLAAAHKDDASDFVANRLVLVDQDATALKTAIALLAISFAKAGDGAAVKALQSRSRHRDFLSPDPLPAYDYAIMNPPYARSSRREGFSTRDSQDLYAYFLERVERTGKGFIAITPASYLSGKKFQSVRSLLEKRNGGHVYVFDNVPDTCFRGFKYGSNNTSKTNFVRAAITVCAPIMKTWRITPILRWSFRSRKHLFATAHNWLGARHIGPDGAWAKVLPATTELWARLTTSTRSLQDLTTSKHTRHQLEVASTPRYYISASSTPLQRTSKHVLYFESEEAFNHAYLLLNSTVPYWWWRTVAGGISLTKQTLLSVPVPDEMNADNDALIAELKRSDRRDRKVKVNAGTHNENIRRPWDLTQRVNFEVIGENVPDFTSLYSSDMFASSESVSPGGNERRSTHLHD